MASNAHQNEEIKPVTAAPENPTPVGNGLFSIRNLLSRKKKSSIGNNGVDRSSNQKNEVTSNGNVADRRIASCRTRSADDTSKTYGFDYQLTWIQDLFMQKESQWNCIGIFGSPGVGKTRLCQDIFNSKQVKEYFLPRIWVSMARQTGEEGEPKIWILKKILDSLGVENQIVQDLSVEDLLYALKLELRGKRYLIVLDDVTEADMFSDRLGASPSEEIGHGHVSKGFPKEYGGAVLVTSRSQKVTKNLVGEQNLHRVVGSTDPNCCWAIYKYWAEKDGLGPLEETKELKDELVQKSGGIPLVIKLMGEIKFSQLKQIQQQQQQQQQNSVQNSSNGTNDIVVAGENNATVI